MSMPSNVAGSANVALGPTRRSDVTRPPSISSSVRPRAMPRIAGTDACPSDTWLMPGTVSSACSRCSGERCAICRDDSIVVAAAGVALMLGAAPTTLRDSCASGLISTVSSPPSRVSTVNGLATCPPGSMTMTWNGASGRGFQVNRPSASVFTVPGRPTIETVALATPLRSAGLTTRPDNVVSWAAAEAAEQRASAKTAERRGFTSSSIPAG